MTLRSRLLTLVPGVARLARERTARARAETEGDRSALLAETSRLLAASLEYETTLERLAGLLVPRLVDTCFIDVVDDVGDIQRIAAKHADPARTAVVRELQARFPPDRHGEHPVARALQTGTPQIAGDVTDAHTAYVVLPLVARGRTLGTLSLVSTGTGRRFTPGDVPLAEDIARRAAGAVDNARLFRESERRRRAAQTLAEVGRFLNQALDPDVVAQRITDSVRVLLGLGTSVFYRVDPETLECTVVAVSGALAAGLEPGTTLPAGTATVGLAVAERRAVTTPDVLADDRFTLAPAFRAR